MKRTASTGTPFAITRSDGRSHAQVLLDYVKDGVPERVYSYSELGHALSAGAGRSFDVAAVRSAVLSAAPRLLREQQRALKNVRLVGYRLARANEHVSLAVDRRRRADVQMRHGLTILRHVRWDEMDANAKAAHEGHLMVTEAIFAQQAALARRQRDVETAIAKLTQRVESMTK